uniref:Predicted protein n=1 Tax=Hordeum vulgare subsp. vulgare TaxID=112509 RepID=F2DMH1_HORVV|nr:predicted protein [Hordeum vulgare subsp. vulgare]
MRRSRVVCRIRPRRSRTRRKTRSISTTAGVRGGRRGVAMSASTSAALEVPPNSKTEVRDCPTTSLLTAGPYT